MTLRAGGRPWPSPPPTHPTATTTTMATITTTATSTTTTDTSSASRVKLVALTQSEWDTIRVALLCHSGEQREAGNRYWAASLMEAYYQVRKQTS